LTELNNTDIETFPSALEH